MPVARKKSGDQSGKRYEIKVDDSYLFQVVVDLRSNANSRRTDTGSGTTVPSTSWQREVLAGGGRIRKTVSLVIVESSSQLVSASNPECRDAGQEPMAKAQP